MTDLGSYYDQHGMHRCVRTVRTGRACVATVIVMGPATFAMPATDIAVAGVREVAGIMFPIVRFITPEAAE